MLKKLSLIWLFAAWATQAMGQTATQAGSLLWKVEGRNLKNPSYLYGTMHSKKKSVFEFNSVVTDKIKECQAFVGELALEKEAMAKAGQLFMLPEGKTLSGLLKKADYEKASELFKKETGYDLKLFDKLQPSYVMVMMQSQDLVNGEMEDALDQYLYNFAKQNGKNTGGLETIEEQAKALNVLSLEKQVDYFVNGVKKYEKEKAKVSTEKEKLLKLYLSRNVEGMTKLVDEQDNKEMPKEMKEALVTKRNVTMADRFTERINKETTFAAVGAAHLGGKEGVIELLRKKGYTVTAVPFEFDGTALKQIKDSTPKPNAATAIAATTNEGSNTATSWHYYQSPNGGYAVYFPAKPTERNQQFTNPETQEPITMYMTMHQTGAGGAMVANYADSKEEIKAGPEQDAKYLKQIEDQMKSLGGKMTAQKDISMGGTNAKEYFFDIMGVMEARLRAVHKGKRTYSLMALYQKADNNAKAEANRFLESFSFMP